MAVAVSFPLAAMMLVGIVLLLSFRRTRTFGVIMLGSVLALGILGVLAYRYVEAPRADRIVKLDYPGNAQIIKVNDGTNTVHITPSPQYPNYQSDWLSAESVKSAVTVKRPGNASNHLVEWSGTMPRAAAPSFASAGAPAKWFAIGVIALVVLVVIGGLILVIVMLSNSKTRGPGIALLAVGSVLAVLILAGFWFIASYKGMRSDFGGTPAIEYATEVSATRPPVAPAKPSPVAELSGVNKPQTTTSQSKPNSKQMINAYQSAIEYYCKAISLPLKPEIKEDIKEKVSTLRINVQDLGQINISGSSFLINSIGQALAKALSERIKENNPQAPIAQENAANVGSPATGAAEAVQTAAEAVSAKSVAEQKTNVEPPPAKSESTEGPKTQPSPVAAVSETTVLPQKNGAVESEKTRSEPQRPAWIGKPPFLYRLNSSNFFPDYYLAVNNKSRQGDCYVMNVSTDPYTTRQECDAAVPDVLQSALNQYVTVYLGPQAQGRIRLPTEELRKMVVAEYEETRPYNVGQMTMMTQVHLLLNFDLTAKKLVDETLHQDVFTQRAAVAGAGFAAVWLLLAVAWGYLKTDLRTKGAYRKRLRAAAALAVLMIAVIIMAVLRSLA
jgi:hypothetical protein